MPSVRSSRRNPVRYAGKLLRAVGHSAAGVGKTAVKFPFTDWLRMVRRRLFCWFPMSIQFWTDTRTGGNGVQVITPLFFFYFSDGLPDHFRLNTYQWGWAFGWVWPDLPLIPGQLLSVAARRMYFQHVRPEKEAKPQMYMAVRD